jgi:hypothetical protein
MTEFSISIKGEMSWAAEEVFVFQEGLCCVNLVITFGIFETNSFNNFDINTVVDADGLLIL